MAASRDMCRPYKKTGIYRNSRLRKPNCFLVGCFHSLHLMGLPRMRRLWLPYFGLAQEEVEALLILELLVLFGCIVSSSRRLHVLGISVWLACCGPCQGTSELCPWCPLNDRFRNRNAARAAICLHVAILQSAKSHSSS